MNFIDRNHPVSDGSLDDIPPMIPIKLPSARSYSIWIVGVTAFIVSVMQRTTLGMAGLEATKHFSVSPSSLSWLVFVQVAVYVAVQIPAGILVERWGSRSMVFFSCILIAAGQLTVAISTHIGLAIAARVIIGLGDGLTFVAVMSLIPRWFPPRAVPIITQLTGMTGQLGQMLSAVPFLLLLHVADWPTAFVAAASTSLLVAILSVMVLRNGPVGSEPVCQTRAFKDVLKDLHRVWHRPGSRLGFFGHMATQFWMMVFTLLWGVPYLISAQGLSPATASGLMVLLVVVAIIIAPLMGLLSARAPRARPWLLLGMSLAPALVWSVILVLPQPAPLWLLVFLVCVLAGGGPASVVALDIGRTSNPPDSSPVAQAVANSGGFLATLALLVLIGLILDLMGGYSFDAFRCAWLLQYPFWLVALIQILTNRRKALAQSSPHASEQAVAVNE